METYVGDTVLLDIDAGIDLSGYATLIIKFRRPNGSIGKWVASLDGTDSTHMNYTTDVNDLNMPGQWTIQAHAMDPIGVPTTELHGKWVNFTVLRPMADTTTPPTTVAPTTAIP